MSSPSDRPSPVVAVAATFTAEPVADALSFWMQELDLGARVEFAPYSQVFQELLDPRSLLSTNTGGVNVVLVRLEDWMKLAGGERAPDDATARLAGNLDDLLAAVRDFAARARSPLVVCFAPPSPAAYANQAHADGLATIERRFTETVDALAGVEVVPSREVVAACPASGYHDAESLALGHVPYTPAGFAALGTLVARRAYGTLGRPHKVIVLDCDQTLWAGVCGEDGALGVEVDAPRAALQDFMAAQREAGRLLCLCSKNAESDVLEVLDRHPGMRLRQDHFVAWRINWKLKSENIIALAAELNLGLDSFVFIDDDPVQCAEVEAACPEVLTLALPPPREIPRFLERIWALDRGALTAEDRTRTSLYRQEAARARLRDSAATFEAFLEGLELRVDIRPMAPAQAPRVSQLTQRTNQFNTTTTRRSEHEVLALSAAGLECLVVDVRDRFGDYGLVGVAIVAAEPPRLRVDSLLLSCRALARGEEHRVLAHLAGLAAARACRSVDVPVVPTEKNQPALSFLDQVGGAHREPDGAGLRFSLPVEVAAAARPEGASPPADEAPDDAGADRASPVEGSLRRVAGLRRIATELHETPRLLAAIETWRGRRQRGRGEAPGTALTPLETLVGSAWERTLGIAQVDPVDDVFRLGATPAMARQTAGWLADVLEVDLSPALGEGLPTPRALARALAARAPGRDLDAVARLVIEIDRLSDDEVSVRLAARRVPLPGDPREAPAARVVSRAAVAERCRQALSAEAAGDESRPAPSISLVGIVTCDRLDALRRALTSYMDNCRHHGRAPEFVVADDSRDARTRDESQALLRSLGARYGVRVAYVGPEEKAAFVRRLVDEGGIPEGAVRCAIRPDLPGPTIGANTNALRLHASGELFFEADDDTVCRLTPHPAAATDGRPGGARLALTGGRDPSEYWFFPHRASLDERVPFVSEDLLALHEQLLGRPVADIVRERGGAGALDVEGVDAALAERLECGNGVVRATFNGLAGDCGWGAPFGVWGAPMGYLLMEGASRRRLVESEAAYHAICTSRSILRVVPRLTVSDDTFGMSTFMALDNRALLPPCMPVGRGQDIVFTRMLWTCVPRALLGHLPWALDHVPAETRRFWPGEMTRSAAGFDSTKLLLACLDGWEGGAPQDDERQRLRRLSEHLREIAGLPLADFERHVLDQATRASQRFAAAAERELDAHRHAPVFWADDVRRYLDALARSLALPDYLTPLDLLDGRTPDEARALGQRMVRDFGELLRWWPDIVDLAGAWRENGYRIGVPL